jgi:uncharacterized protein YwlG (UPF0340 family)
MGPVSFGEIRGCTHVNRHQRFAVQSWKVGPRLERVYQHPQVKRGGALKGKCRFCMVQEEVPVDERR